MFMPAIIAIAQVVGATLGAKTAIEGLKEKNIAKAVLGGLGAYAGVSGLAGGAASGMTGTAAATNELGTVAAKEVAGDMAASNVAAAGNEASQSINAIADAGKLPSTGMMSPVTQAPVSVVSEQPGFLSRVGEWANKNPTLAYGAMQLGGNLLGGYAQGEALQDQLDQERKEKEAERKRREYSVGTGFMDRYKYNPTSGWSVK